MANLVQIKSGPIQASQNRKAKVMGSSGNTVPFQTAWVQFINTNLLAALSGTATAVVAIIERSAVDPNLGSLGAVTPIISPADSAGFTGSLATGIPPNIYSEPGIGWWRINVTSVTGGTCTATLSGLSGKS